MKYDTAYLKIRICLAIVFFLLLYYSHGAVEPQISVSGNFPPYFSVEKNKVSGLCSLWFKKVICILETKYKEDSGFARDSRVIFEFSLRPGKEVTTVSIPLNEIRWGLFCRTGSVSKSLDELKKGRAGIPGNAMESILEVVSGSSDYALLPELTAKHIAGTLGSGGFVFRDLKMPSGFIYLNVTGPISEKNILALKRSVREFRGMQKPGELSAASGTASESAISDSHIVVAYAGAGALLLSGVSAFSLWAFFRKRLRRSVESAGTLNTIFRATVSTIDDLLFVIDRDFRLIRTNLHKYRKDLDLASGKVFCYEIVRNQSTPCAKCRVAEIFQTGRPMNFIDDDCGIGIFRDCSAVPLFDNEGKVSGIVKVLRPIDGKRHLDIMPFLKLVFDVVSEEVIVTDEMYSIIYVNRAYEHNTGKQLCDFIGKYPAFFEKKFQDREDYRSLTRSMLQGCSWHGYLNEPAGKSGDIMRKEVFVAPFLPDKSGPGFFMFIAAPASISSKLKHSNRVELLGFIAGAITHDFNNILMMIMSNAELAGAYSGGGKIDSALKRIINTGTHARHLVENIERFYKRREKTEHSPICLDKVVREAADEIEIILPQGIEFEKNIASPVWPVLGDETEIYQIILNLCMNSVNAMREKKGESRLRLSLSNVEPENELITEGLPLRQSKTSCVRLSVSDTGPGMDENTVNRIYEPFFTARLDGKGSGLGLAIVKDIVDGMGGEICVRSVSGEGTSFDIYLQRCQGDEELKK